MPALLAVIAALAVAAAPPAPTRWVEDHASLMSEPARAALDARLEAYEHATGHQIVVWIGTSLDGAPLDDWAVKTFAAWKLGRAGIDDGCAIFVLARDRAIDIEVGYGLEDRVPDAIASRIVRDVMAPKLRANDADGAITAGADAVISAIEGKAWSPSSADTTDSPSTATWIAGVVAAIAIVLVLVFRPSSLWWLLWIVGRSIGARDDRGGFGGHGGRSGGGGARGGW